MTQDIRWRDIYNSLRLLRPAYFTGAGHSQAQDHLCNILDGPDYSLLLKEFMAEADREYEDDMITLESPYPGDLFCTRAQYYALTLRAIRQRLPERYVSQTEFDDALYLAQRVLDDLEGEEVYLDAETR